MRTQRDYLLHKTLRSAYRTGIVEIDIGPSTSVGGNLNTDGVVRISDNYGLMLEMMKERERG
jgi:hypothetical protein